MKSIIKLGLFLVVGILVYNFFLGTPEEKQQSKEIFQAGKELTKSAVNLLKSEKEKFDDGKYDGALTKLENLFGKLKRNAEDIQDSQLLDRLAELESKRKALEEHLADSEVQEYSDEGAQKRDRESIKEEWDELISETESLMKQMEKNN